MHHRCKLFVSAARLSCPAVATMAILTPGLQCQGVRSALAKDWVPPSKVEDSL
jgi:hypothetical protein